MYKSGYIPRIIAAWGMFASALFLLGNLFLGLGSTTFAYLWFKSRYVPRGLAAWGIFASLVLSISILAMMAFPGLTAVLGFAYWAPIFLFDVILGFWLLVKGIRAPAGLA